MFVCAAQLPPQSSRRCSGWLAVAAAGAAEPPSIVRFTIKTKTTTTTTKHPTPLRPTADIVRHYKPLTHICRRFCVPVEFHTSSRAVTFPRYERRRASRCGASLWYIYTVLTCERSIVRSVQVFLTVCVCRGLAQSRRVVVAPQLS